MRALFAASVCEFVAAVTVIFLYVLIGCLGISVVFRARKTIENSRAKLAQLQFSSGDQRHAGAMTAGRALAVVFV